MVRLLLAVPTAVVKKRPELRASVNVPAGAIEPVVLSVAVTVTCSPETDAAGLRVRVIAGVASATSCVIGSELPGRWLLSPL